MTDQLTTIILGQGVVGPTGPQLPTEGVFGAGGKLDIGKVTDFANVLTEGGIAARQLRSDAETAKVNATLTEQQTKQALEKQDRERRLRAGAARAAAGASGTLFTGSPLDVMQSSATQEALDLLTIESEGDLREQQFRAQAKEARSQLPFSLLATAGKATEVLTRKSRGFF